MTKTELVAAISKDTAIARSQVEAVLDSFAELIAANYEPNKVAFFGGKIKLKYQLKKPRKFYSKILERQVETKPLKYAILKFK